MKVLLIEDSPTIQAQLTKYLEEYGASVVTSSSGENAVQLLDQFSIDLVICDIEMPGLNGLETVPIIREHFSDRWVPIVFITSKDSVDDYIKGFEAGADDYLIKPVNKNVLHAKIRILQRFILMQRLNSQLRDDAEKFSRKDLLTQSYTHEHFKELASLQWSILARQNLPVSFLIVEVDEYDSYADYYSEPEAHKVLSRIAQCIQWALLRPGDLLGRLENQYFIVLLPDTGFSGAKKVAERICTQVAGLCIEHKLSQVSGVVTVSIGGGTCLRLKKSSLEETLDLAGEALNKVKERSRNDYLVDKKTIMEVTNVPAESSRQ